MEDVDRLIEEMRIFGLSEYEARAFLALLLQGVATPEEVASASGIPRTSAYRVLDSLERKGFAVLMGKRPKTYKAEDLMQIKRAFMERVEDVFETLEIFRDLMSDRGVPQLVYTLSGRENVLGKIVQMIRAAESEVWISSPRFAEMKGVIGRELARVVKRGVRVIIITDRPVRMDFPAEVSVREGIIATDLVVDRKRALLASPDLEACGYTDNPALAEHLWAFLNMMLER
jgi:sugar-specific transcriptional regulator TrmB